MSREAICYKKNALLILLNQPVLLLIKYLYLINSCVKSKLLIFKKKNYIILIKHICCWLLLKC